MLFFDKYCLILIQLSRGGSMKVKAVTLGCKVNAYENEFILSSFKDKGYEIVNDNEKSDIYVINTCSVTNQSDAKSRKVINRIVRENPDAVIVVMGCFIEANKDYSHDGVSIIIGNKDKNRVVELVEEYLKNKEDTKLLYDDFDHKFEDMFITNMSSRTRAYVKIQDGCENFCSYCIIPYTRGKCRSKDKNMVIKEVKSLVNNGYKEVVLTGIHTGHYGEDGNTSFPDLLKELVQIPNLYRLRISSIEITELNDDFLDVLKNSNIIVNHIHIPLQAGSATILKLMNRKYDTKYFLNKINEIRRIRPLMSFTTDVIVGFPYETIELFKETCDFVKEVGFSKLHVFPYSRRKGTKADLMPNQVDERIKKERVNELIEVSNKLERNYLDKFINEEVLVLIETNDDGVSIGHTDNFLKVVINGVYDKNSFVDVKIIRRIDNYLEGEVINERV